MSLPPGFLDELRSRLSIARVVGRKVMWDNRKSNQAKGDMWAPCPFHQEKTASFHVDDQKGYYYCFGCHAKGDAISFVRETENVGFMEAIEILAGEAGMPMPERDPRAQEKADWRTQLVEVMELAVQFFRLQLKTQAGAAARDYLAGRGLSEEAQARWEIGLAPPGWSNLWDHLTGKGVEKDQIVAVGLARGEPLADTATTPTQMAIDDGFSGTGPAPEHQDLLHAGRLGEAILSGAAQIDADRGARRDDLSAALATLRAIGLEDTARRASLQILLLEEVR